MAAGCGRAGFVLAGLWRDVGRRRPSSGRWHAAIISGLVQGHDVFYAQWHDAPTPMTLT